MSYNTEGTVMAQKTFLFYDKLEGVESSQVKELKK